MQVYTHYRHHQHGAQNSEHQAAEPDNNTHPEAHGDARMSNTMPTAWARLTMKSLIESLIMSDCQEISSSSMPMGRAAVISCSRSSMARPTVTTFTPATGAAARQ